MGPCELRDKGRFRIIKATPVSAHHVKTEKKKHMYKGYLGNARTDL